MPLDLTADCAFTGPALPEPFVKFNLEAELNRLSLLPKASGPEARALHEHWQFVRRKLRNLVAHGGGLRVQNHVIEPLLAQLGYARIEAVEAVQTREGDEDGGTLLVTEDGASRLRVWCVDLDADLDAPARRGLAYRFSHTRIAQRVLLTTGERLGILTNGLELRLIISDPARVDSQVAISIDPHWKRSRELPDSVRLLLALASPAGVKALPELIDKARLQQAKVTKDLREQARHAIREFIQEILDHPENRSILAELVNGDPVDAHRGPSPAPELGGSPHPGGLPQLGTPSPGAGTQHQAADGMTVRRSPFAVHSKHELARALWHEGLITVYRLLFILKLESTDDPARSFSFASTSLWRNTFSPSVALAPIVRRVLDHGAQTGRLLQDGLRALFRMLSDGLQCTELNVRPMAGALFAPASTPLLGRLHWTEAAVARLLDNLLWTRAGRGATARERVHYGPLDVEDLGRVYEALLELEPGIAAETMCRLRRAKLEVVVPAAQGEKYKPVAAGARGLTPAEAGDTTNDDEPEEEEETSAASAKKTKVEWIEEIPPGRFYLRVGLGRKATGSFYTPHSFVRFLVKETLGPLVERAVNGELRTASSGKADGESQDNPVVQGPGDLAIRPETGASGLADRAAAVDSLPDPCAILKLKVIDKAMGSGHFLVESCRFLGEALYDAARRCDELAAAAEKLAEAYRKSGHPDQAAEQEARAAALRQRVVDLPDPDDELLRYLPSRSVEGTAGGVSHNKALALCRRMVAVHCLYGVDKNPLAVELAKLALWIECHAEGLPLTFLDHRLVVGDSLTGPFFEHLLKYPGSQQPLNDLFTQGLSAKLTAALGDALQHVRALEATVGVTVADIAAKQAAKTRLDRDLAPFKILAAAWSGGVMLGAEGCDDTAYAALAQAIGETANREQGTSAPSSPLTIHPSLLTAPLLRMVAKGLGLPAEADWQTICGAVLCPPFAVRHSAIPALSFDLAFPEVFYPDANLVNRAGFDADLGNPPWDQLEIAEDEFWAFYEIEAVASRDHRQRKELVNHLKQNPLMAARWGEYLGDICGLTRLHGLLFSYQSASVGNSQTTGRPDLWRLFAERTAQVIAPSGNLGFVLPSAFHGNEGATGIRSLYLDELALRCCYSFENRRKLFEIDSRFKFALVVASSPGPTRQFKCAFYRHDDSWLFRLNEHDEALLNITHLEAARLFGQHRVFIEARSRFGFELVKTVKINSVSTWGDFIRGVGMAFSNGIECHRRPDVAREAPPEFLYSRWVCDTRGKLPPLIPLLDGKNAHQFTDQTEHQVGDVGQLERLTTSAHWALSLRHFRVAFRYVAASTNERTLIAALLPALVGFTNGLVGETAPEDRPSFKALATLALLNSCSFDFQVRQQAGTHVNRYVLAPLGVPEQNGIHLFLAHSALRLTCNHAGYAPLWREQLGEAWREAGAAFTWPVLSGDDCRWAVRAAIDAVAAHAYGLTRDQYAHVLSTFSHSSYKDAPRQCLAAFDELQSIGLEAFTRKHDPYWDIPLNENLPQPVIDLPIPQPITLKEDAPAYRHGELFDFQTTSAPPGSGALFNEQPVTKRRGRPSR